MTRTIIISVFLFTILIKTGDSKTSGISQFWTDDFKVFDQIYGKTSDKELYGATLPPTISFDIDKITPIEISASEKKERYLTNGKNVLDLDIYPNFGDRYAKLFSKSYSDKKPSLQFVSLSDFKPISESNDPETYNYLKRLEKMSKKNELAKHKVLSNESSEEDEAYKSIQDILDAHEANKSPIEDEEYSRPKIKTDDSYRYSRNRNRSKVKSIHGNSLKSRCVGRCRNTQRTRPYIRKIKHYRYSKR